MTTDYFPITSAIGKDANTIISALSTRSEQIKCKADSYGIVTRVTIVALQTLGLAAGIVTAASFPAAAVLLTAAPLTIGAVGLVVSISALALHVLLYPRSPGELIVKDHWKRLFEALREGDGEKIIKACQVLFKQKDQRNGPFVQCLGTLPSEETNPFFHKACLVGYIQIALEHLRKNEDDLAKSKAHLALSHFDASGLPDKIKQFITSITENPKRMRYFIDGHNLGHDLHALDYLITVY